jgi:hypothetical protein
MIDELSSLADSSLSDISDRQKESSSFTLQKTETFIGSDAVDPRVKLGVFAEMVDVLYGFL